MSTPCFRRLRFRLMLVILSGSCARGTGNSSGSDVILEIVWERLPSLASTRFRIDSKGTTTIVMQGKENAYCSVDAKLVRRVIGSLPRMRGVAERTGVDDGWGFGIRAQHDDGYLTRLYLRELATPGLIDLFAAIHSSSDDSIRAKLDSLVKRLRSLPVEDETMLLVDRLSSRGGEGYRFMQRDFPDFGRGGSSE